MEKTLLYLYIEFETCKYLHNCMTHPTGRGTKEK